MKEEINFRLSQNGRLSAIILLFNVYFKVNYLYFIQFHGVQYVILSNHLIFKFILYSRKFTSNRLRVHCDYSVQYTFHRPISLLQLEPNKPTSYFTDCNAAMTLQLHVAAVHLYKYHLMFTSSKHEFVRFIVHLVIKLH